MPQKKNPHSLERVKALAGQAAGWLPSMMSCQRSVLSTDLDAAFGDDLVTPAVEASLGSLQLLTESVRTLTIDRAVMAERAGVFWSTTSHLADELVRRFDLSFRTAHHIVARFVRESIAAGHRPAEASAELLDRAARETVGRELRVSSQDLRDMLDARRFLDTRVSEGGAAPGQVLEHVAAMSRTLSDHERWRAEELGRVGRSLAELDRVARALA
jgi:argininosuccinate lyase